MKTPARHVDWFSCRGRNISLSPLVGLLLSLNRFASTPARRLGARVRAGADRAVALVALRWFRSWPLRASTVLVALLQRTPAARLCSLAVELPGSIGGAVLRPLAVAGATLGALDSLAGATVLVATTPTPAALTTGTNVQIAFTVSNTINIGSWKVTGTLPPGLVLSAMEGGNTLTGPGTLDATTPGTSDGYGDSTPGNNTTTPQLTGTPTQTGNFTFSMQAFEFGGLTGLASGTFSYTVNVTAVSIGIVPSISAQPQPLSITTGGNASFSVTASGTPSPNYQWMKDGAALAGATSATLTVGNAQLSDAGNYTVVVTNSAGAVTSSAAALTVSPPIVAPLITRNPAAQTIAVGSTAVFSADVTASPAPAFQWRKNGAILPGATSAMLVVSNATAADAGTYSVDVTNSAGSASSTAAALVVNPASAADVGRLVNLSIRTNAGTGAQTLIVGFSVGGSNTSGAKPLLIRAIGPTLADYGVTGVLADPVATIIQNSATIASNDNWGGDATIAARITQVAAFPLSATSLDAALPFNPTNGTYSLEVTGRDGGTGIALAEIYDATPAAAISSSTPRLVNVSARTQVGTGNDILIAGFVIGGSTAKTVLLRGIGPALTGFGIDGALADPKLQLFSGPTLIQENDNWGGDPQLSAIGTRVGAFGLSDPNSKDAMMLVTLSPGLYTVEVSGVGGTTGVALVELYDIQ